MTTALAAAFFALAGLQPVEKTDAADAARAPVDYADERAWLCLPGRADACTTDLSVTVVAADGTMTVEPGPDLDQDPPADCFYVYPTVSTDRTMNADMEADEAERAVVRAHLARFASACRLYAPLYRQQSLAGLRSRLLGRRGGDRDLAYADVRAAFEEYLAAYNDGRPFVLIGHSQGASMLARLLPDEVEGTEAGERMLSAMLLGTTIEVPTGEVVGGSFDATPLCEADTQTGCLIAYAAFREDVPPREDALFGVARTEGRQAACVSPAALLGRGEGTGEVLPAEGSANGRKPRPWARGGTITTPFVKVPGLLTARCEGEAPYGYLAVTTHADKADPRTDDVGGDVQVLGRRLKGWGLHLLDVNLAQDDLIALAERQADAWWAAREGGPSEAID